MISTKNETVYRTHSTDESGALEIGAPDMGIRLVPSDHLEFLLRIGEDGSSEPTTEILPQDCERTSSDPENPERTLTRFLHSDSGFRIDVESVAGPGPRLYKTLTIHNTGDNPVMLLDIVLERIRVPEGITLSGGGCGQPVFIEGIGFTGVEFPESENVITGSEYSLEYYPSIRLAPGETYRTEGIVFQFSKDDPEHDLRRYAIESRNRQPSELLAIYSTRGTHDCEGPSECITNEQLDQAIELKQEWHIPFECFMLDYTHAGIDDIGGENRFQADGFESLLHRARGADIEPGVRISVRPDFTVDFRRSLIDLIGRYQLKIVELELATEDNAGNPHRYTRYRTARGLLDLFASIREAHPDTAVFGSQFPGSPWWLRYLDVITSGKMDASDVPAPSLEDSRILHTDLCGGLYDLDFGTCIGYSDGNYWCGKQAWRKSVIMSLSRTGHLSLSGELNLLDEDDRLFFQRVMSMRRIYSSNFRETRRVLGDPHAGQVYGYSNVAGGKGLVTLFNPSWERRSIEVYAADLGCDQSVRNMCMQLFPDMEGASISADGGHFHLHIDPWEVLWLDVGPSDQHSELLESKSSPGPNCPMHITQVALPVETPRSIEMMMEHTRFDSGGTYRARIEIPTRWEGFPLLVDLRGLSGELYINNSPVGVQDGSTPFLLYPWTPSYGLMQFGGENLFYLAVRDTVPEPRREFSIQPLTYFSSSACREDWESTEDAAMVVVVRYLKDGQPVRSSSDPRIAQCAVWLDGMWMNVRRVPPLVPRIWSKFSWAAFMLDLDSDWECVRVLVPQIVDVDYDVQFFLMDRSTLKCPE